MALKALYETHKNEINLGSATTDNPAAIVAIIEWVEGNEVNAIKEATNAFDSLIQQILASMVTSLKK